MSNDSIEATMRLEVFAVGLLFLDGCAVQRHPNRFTLDPPWSVELPADYDNSVTPELRFASATFAHLGDKLVLKIVWKDHKLGFKGEILEEHEVVWPGKTPPGSSSSPSRCRSNPEQLP